MIFGDHVRLRAVERSDLPNFVEWLNDPDVREGMAMIIPLSREVEDIWFEDMLKRPVSEHPLVIEIKLDDAWIAVGNCGFLNIDWRVRAAEVGIFIGEKSYWNQGYGTEVMRLLLRHGFQTLNLNRIALLVYETNPRAIRAYEKAGFVREGIQREAMFNNGCYIDVIGMSVLRSEWNKRGQDI